MSDELFENEELTTEYEETFSGEEQLEHMLKGITGRFSTRVTSVPVASIILPKMKKEMRDKTLVGLTGLVTSLSGVVSPIHVMTLEDADDEYTLLDGARRLYSAIKAGQEDINAVIWDFEDKDEGQQLTNILGLILNRSQRLSNSECWSMLKTLELVNKCTPGKIEYLLQLESGDAMKLKDVMLAEGEEDIEELKEKFLSDELSIDAAYKKLTSIRKKENREEKLERDEDRQVSSTEEGSESGIDGSAKGKGEHPRLSTDEVKEILEMGTDDVSDQTLDELRAKGEAMRAKENEPHVQKVGERHPVDPEIKKATLKRDGFKCRCCGTGDELYLSILVFHHLVPVFAGGPDTVENGLTLCSNCHLMLHNYIDGHLHGDMAKYDEETQKVLRNIFKYGNVAIKAAQKMGLKQADVHKLDAASRQHIMPNTNVKVNNEAFEGGQEADDE